jgi:hypothetical protein
MRRQPGRQASGIQVPLRLAFPAADARWGGRPEHQRRTTGTDPPHEYLRGDRGKAAAAEAAVSLGAHTVSVGHDRPATATANHGTEQAKGPNAAFAATS